MSTVVRDIKRDLKDCSKKQVFIYLQHWNAHRLSQGQRRDYKETNPKLASDKHYREPARVFNVHHDSNKGRE